MARTTDFLDTSVGKKIAMAVTGLILFGFVVAHMIGNLQAYAGADALNAYALWLREFLHGAGLWIARGVLLAAVAVHIWAATALTVENRRARPVGYRERRWEESTYASRTMVWSGPILALFVIYHLLHLTTGNLHPNFVEGDVYHNFVSGFRVLPASIFYIVAMLCLGLHLYHGAWSMLQTLGLSHPRWNPLRQAVAGGITTVVVLGNISFPLAVLFGVIR